MYFSCLVDGRKGVRVSKKEFVQSQEHPDAKNVETTILDDLFSFQVTSS